jgi:hypothetical protein
MRQLALAAVFILAPAALLAAEPAAAPAPAPAAAEVSYFCYWTDAAHKQMGTTSLFAAKLADDGQVSDLFLDAMRRDSKIAGRVYDCGYRRDAAQAAADREKIRTAYAQKGFTVEDIAWTPADG